ncbi:MAG: DUF4376 domain-containing protein [Trueperaceae bacterium]
MIRFIVYDPASGEVLRSGTCHEDDLAMQAEPGLLAMEHATATPNTHRVVGGEPVEYSPAGRERRAAPPGQGFVWDAATENWIDERSLIDVRADLLLRVRTERDARIEGGFVWDGSPFDSDAAISQPRLLGLFTTALAGGLPPEGYPWRLADNTWRVLSANDAVAVWAAFQAHMAGHFSVFAAHEQAILTEADAEVLREYDPTTLWP